MIHAASLNHFIFSDWDKIKMFMLESLKKREIENMMIYVTRSSFSFHTRHRRFDVKDKLNFYVELHGVLFLSLLLRQKREKLKFILAQHRGKCERIYVSFKFNLLLKSSERGKVFFYFFFTIYCRWVIGSLWFYLTILYFHTSTQ